MTIELSVSNLYVIVRGEKERGLVSIADSADYNINGAINSARSDLTTPAPQRKHERTLRLSASTVDAKTAISAKVFSIFILCDIMVEFKV